MSSPRDVLVRDATVIVTILNEQDSVLVLLESIRAQSILPAEIVVIDGGSVDRTVDIVTAWPAPPGVAVRVGVVPGAGISQGRNAAIAAASHERVLVTDAGARLAPVWVQAMLEAFDSGAQVVAGFFEPAGESYMARVLARVIVPTLDEIDTETFLPSSRSLGLLRSAWERVGGYPEWLDYCEDLVFDLELKKAGAAFVFAAEALVTWDARPSLLAFGKQYYRYARGDGKAGLWPRRHLLRYGAYSTGIVLLAAVGRWPVVAVPLAFGFLAYQAKFLRRLWLGRYGLGGSAALGLAMTPLLVVWGDIAKMVGYPAGLAWRRYRDRTPQTGAEVQWV